MGGNKYVVVNDAEGWMFLVLVEDVNGYSARLKGPFASDGDFSTILGCRSVSDRPTV